MRGGDDQRPRVISEAIPIATILELALTPIAEAARGSGIALRQVGSSLASLADAAQTPAARVALASVTGVVLQQASTLSGSHMRGRIEAECRRTLATLQDHNPEVDALPSVAQG